MHAKTPPNEIKSPHYQEIWNKLQGLSYPCTIVVYGAERTHRTTYRGEHSSAFGICFCSSPEEAWNVVDCGWPGYPPDLDIYTIPSPTEPEKIQ